MKFVHVIHRPIPRLTIIMSSIFIRFCPRYGNLQKHTHVGNKDFQSFSITRIANGGRRRAAFP